MSSWFSSKRKKLFQRPSIPAPTEARRESTPPPWSWSYHSIVNIRSRDRNASLGRTV